ncbi:MAG: CARDB domain-containing protein, partial [Desulfuromonadales bacterium]
GDGTTTQRLTPTQVTGLNGIIAISAGDSHSIALKDNGTIWSWGHNAYGQLGDGTTVNRPVAVQSGTLNLIVVRISGASPTDIPQGSSYTFTPDALGAVSFSITNKPAWALFDPTSGTLSGTPGAADTGTSSGIIITAKNGAYIDSLPAFAITVHGPVAISVTAGSGGTVNGPAGITYGGSVSYSITPETGYHLVDVLVDGSSVGTVTNYTFTNVKAPHTISATFAIDTFTVTRTPGANGTISGPATVNYGDTPTYTILPATGYHVVDVTVDGGTVGAINSYAFGAITANHTISATFAINTYTVTLAAGANGTITGPATATYGSNANYSITPASGYHVVDVLVDGVSTGAVTSYSFANVTANHTISATFAINSYAISASAGTGGTISGPASATYNSSATYAITPNSGYYIAGVTVDGVAVGALTSYTFTSINAAHTIAATFALPPLSVTTTALASATTGKVYSQTLAATGGLASYTWSISNGALPAGLTLSSAGVISGTPTAVATGTFTVQVRDAVGTTATQPLSIVIAAPLKADLTVTAVSGPVTITRGTTRYTFTATVKNQGTAASAAAKVGFYLSTGTTISTTVSKSNSLVGTTVLPALAAGGSSTVTLTVAVPTSAIAAGSYYIGAYADSGNTVSELSETNNGNATAVRVKVR